MTGGIPNEKWERILALFRKHPAITEVILYGSRANGNFHDGSDIDLALKGEKLSSLEVNQITLAYEDLYFLWKLDLILYETISNPDLKSHIDRVGKSFPLA